MKNTRYTIRAGNAVISILNFMVSSSDMYRSSLRLLKILCAVRDPLGPARMQRNIRYSLIIKTLSLNGTSARKHYHNFQIGRHLNVSGPPFSYFFINLNVGVFAYLYILKAESLHI